MPRKKKPNYIPAGMEVFDLNQYLADHRSAIRFPLPSGQEYEYVEPRPTIVCNDGFHFSAQASDLTYCCPRLNTGPYTHVEIGFPSMIEPLFMPYIDGDTYPLWMYMYLPEKAMDVAECIIRWIDKRFGRGMYWWRVHPCGTVYGRVPVTIVEQVVAKHGGYIGYIPIPNRVVDSDTVADNGPFHSPG